VNGRPSPAVILSAAKPALSGSEGNLVGLLLFAILAALVALVAACGGGDDSATQSPAFSGPTFAANQTKAPTRTAVPSTAGGTAPPVASPEPGPIVQKLGEGALEITIGSGESYRFDPLSLPVDPGRQPPPCAAFVFAFTWQVTDPYPADNVDVRWRLNRMGGAVEIARGPSGDQTVGCGVVEAVNSGDASVSLSVRYLIGTAPGS